jgi:hypothetical protein
VTNLPVLGLAKEHLRVLRLADLASVIVLGLLDVLLGLDTVILGEGALVSLSAGVCEKVRTDGLDAAASGRRDLTDGLEVLLGRPSFRESWQSQTDL